MVNFDVFAAIKSRGLSAEAEHATIERARHAAHNPPHGPLTWGEYLARLDWFLTFYGRMEGLQ